MRIKQCMGLMCLWLCFNWMAQAQVITLENGFSISKVKDWYGQKNLLPYQMSLGVDYMDRGWFQLSSQIGFLKKGGKTELMKIFLEDGVGGKERDRLHLRYLTFNTTFNLKSRPQNGWVWFAGLGPRVDIYLSNSLYMDMFGVMDNKPQTSSMSGACPVVVGLKCVAGVERDYGKVRIGIRAAYLPSFNPSIKHKSFGLPREYSYRDRTFTLGVSLGYILPREKGRIYTVRRTKP